jgi:hypothetical protein
MIIIFYWISQKLAILEIFIGVSGCDCQQFYTVLYILKYNYSNALNLDLTLFSKGVFRYFLKRVYFLSIF